MLHTTPSGMIEELNVSSTSDGYVVNHRRGGLLYPVASSPVASEPYLFDNKADAEAFMVEYAGGLV